MIKWIMTHGLLLLLVSCHLDKDTKVDKDKVRFRTTDSSVLFFKNVRILFYDKQTLEAAKMDQYRIKERLEDENQPLINLVIVHNWLQDEAYIFLEPNSLLNDEDPIVIGWKDSISGQVGEYLYSPGSKEEQFAFATQIYGSILDNHELSIQLHGEAVPFMADPAVREPFRKTMVDFYRLVNIFK